MTDERTKPYKPDWVGGHVTGSYTILTRDEDGIPEEQTVQAYCSICKVPFKRTCSSGMPRHHIDTFSRVHLHRHPLRDPIPRKRTA